MPPALCTQSHAHPQAQQINDLSLSTAPESVRSRQSQLTRAAGRARVHKTLRPAHTLAATAYLELSRGRGIRKEMPEEPHSRICLRRTPRTIAAPEGPHSHDAHRMHASHSRNSPIPSAHRIPSPLRPHVSQSRRARDVMRRTPSLYRGVMMLGCNDAAELQRPQGGIKTGLNIAMPYDGGCADTADWHTPVPIQRGL